MHLPPAEQQTPAVWKWYVAYCIIMALGFFLLAVTGLFTFFVDPAELEMSSGEATLMSVTLVFVGLLLLFPYAVAPFLPRQNWAWVLGIVLISIGMTSTCCLPVAIPLLIFWIKPENKAFFGGDT